MNCAMNRLILKFFLALVANFQMIGTASTGFLGFGSDDKGKSGLDFNRGYDINTVATVSGCVTSLPREGTAGSFSLSSGREPGRWKLAPARVPSGKRKEFRSALTTN